jgi:hypothetical protein
MVSIEIENLKRDLRVRLGRFVGAESRRCHAHLYRTLEEIRKTGYPAYLCGGAVRDLLLSNSVPRDLDIILGYVSNQTISGLFPENVKGSTGLGGVKLQVKDWTIDMWGLKDTWAFRDGVITGNGFSDYPKTTFLDIDAIAIQLFASGTKAREIHSKGFFEAIASKTIELSYEDNPAPAKCIVRALRVADKFKFAIGPKLASYMVSYVDKHDIEELTEIYQRRYTSKSITLDIFYSYMKSIKEQLRTSAKSSVQICSAQDSNSNQQHPCLF